MNDLIIEYEKLINDCKKDIIKILIINTTLAISIIAIYNSLNNLHLYARIISVIVFLIIAKILTDIISKPLKEKITYSKEALNRIKNGTTSTTINNGIINNTNNNITNNKNIVTHIVNNNVIVKKYNEYHKKAYLMTKAENNFYLLLKKITDKNNLTIFSQVDLERIINVNINIDYKKYFSNRNKIKSRSIDFVIVNNKDNKIICAIELDDNTHLRQDRIDRDKFINELFESVSLPLLRIKTSYNYNLIEIEQKIKECI